LLRGAIDAPDSTLSGNSAVEYGAGGAIWTAGHAPTISGSTFAGNFTDNANGPEGTPDSINGINADPGYYIDGGGNTGLQEP
jgi:hypothetical protein